MKKMIFVIFIFSTILLSAGEKYLYDIEITRQDDAFNNIFGKLDVWSFYIDNDGHHHYRVASDADGIKIFDQMPAAVLQLDLIANLMTGIQKKAVAAEYHDLETIYKTLDDLEANYPALAKVYELGKTFEGNPIKAIKISTSPDKNVQGKTEVLYVGEHHAREWISVEVSLHLAEFILEKYDKNRRVYDMVNASEIWVLPTLNADGYKYTWADVTNNRLWRKNRTPIEKDGVTTYGVDPNRNYDAHFGGEGTSTDPNNETYCGEAPFSIEETQTIRAFVGAEGIAPLNGWVDDVQGIISYHSFSQYILYPYGAVHEYSPKNLLMKDIADEMARLIYQQTGVSYVPMKSSTMYIATGDLTDWFHRTHDLKTAYTIELRPDANQLNGFILAPEQIPDVVKENIPAALYYLENLIFDDPYIDTDVNGNGIVDYYEDENDINKSKIALDYSKLETVKEEETYELSTSRTGCSLTIY